MKKIAVGVDIGGTNTVLGLVSENGEIFSKTSFKTAKCETVSVFVQELKKAVEACETELNFDYRLLGIGIGAPNANFFSGSIEFAANLPWKGIVKLADEVKAVLNLPVFVTNDANAAAVGEMVYGGAAGMNDFVVITLGTGLGSGIVSDGKVLYGYDGLAGELGHVIYERNGRMCGCGRKGCIETYVSARGICRTVLDLLAKTNTVSCLRAVCPSELDSKLIFEAARKADPIAVEAFNVTGRILGEVLADLTAIIRPQAYFLFGGLALSENFILQPAKTSLEKNLLAAYKGKVGLYISQINDYDAAVLGASALVWNNL